MQHRTTTVNVTIFAVVASLLIGSIVFGLAKPVAVTANPSVLITIKPGMTASEIAELLYEKGIIKSVLTFRIVAKVGNMGDKLQAGEYAVSQDMSSMHIVEMLATGETAYRQLTVPEGYTTEQIAALIQQEQIGSADKFKTAASQYAPFPYMTAKKSSSYKVEGYLFPDTYRIPKDATEEQVLAMMTAQFDKRFTSAMQERTREMGLSVSEVITLASLVEKEAKLDSDRPLIAAVFLNRLQQGMPLQSCATIQYVLGHPKEELSVEDVRIDSPYNTYQNIGLPPGPIGNPGLAAINAVLYPAATDYLYFVADKQGAHHFSKTYDEHLMMIEKVRN